MFESPAGIPSGKQCCFSHCSVFSFPLPKFPFHKFPVHLGLEGFSLSFLFPSGLYETISASHSQFQSFTVCINPEFNKNLGEVFTEINPGDAMGQRKWEKCGWAGFWDQSTLEIKPPVLWALHSAQNPPAENFE